MSLYNELAARAIGGMAVAPPLKPSPDRADTVDLTSSQATKAIMLSSFRRLSYMQSLRAAICRQQRRQCVCFVKHAKEAAGVDEQHPASPPGLGIRRHGRQQGVHCFAAICRVQHHACVASRYLATLYRNSTSQQIHRASPVSYTCLLCDCQQCPQLLLGADAVTTTLCLLQRATRSRVYPAKESPPQAAQICRLSKLLCAPKSRSCLPQSAPGRR